MPATESPPLPHHWRLRDGTEATLRAITPGDFAIETAFVDGLSADTSFNRLFSTRHPDAREIARWTNVDASREEALIVTSTRAGAEFMLGVARYVRDDASPDAEFAIVIGDDWKRAGVGLALLCALIPRARNAGVRELYGATLSTNAGMIALGRRLGFAARRVIGDATLTRLALRLQDGAAPTVRA